MAAERAGLRLHCFALCIPVAHTDPATPECSQLQAGRPVQVLENRHALLILQVPKTVHCPRDVQNFFGQSRLRGSQAVENTPAIFGRSPARGPVVHAGFQFTFRSARGQDHRHDARVNKFLPPKLLSSPPITTVSGPEVHTSGPIFVWDASGPKTRRGIYAFAHKSVRRPSTSCTFRPPPWILNKFRHEHEPFFIRPVASRIRLPGRRGA
jgi:hypothetical protein